jgi:hypothetical protein
MHENYSDIIFRLKQQPRHGQQDIDDAEAEKNRRLQDLEDLNLATTRLSEITKALTKDYTNLQAGISTSISVMKNYGKAILNSAKNANFLERRNADLAKSFGLNVGNAAAFGQQLDKQAQKLKIGGESLRKYTNGMKGVAGGFLTGTKQNKAYQESLINTSALLQNRLGLEAEIAQGYETYSAMFEGTSTDQLGYQANLASRLEQITGLQGVQRDLIQEIGNLTANLQLQYGRIPGSLELAILKSRALGLSMENLNAAGSNLLNIESSIGQELEYQLLSGRRLVDEQGNSLTNAYREATLRGDASKQADLLNQILEQEGDTLKNNMLARQQMSELLGMDEAVLAKSLQKQEIMKKIGADMLMDIESDDFKNMAAAAREALSKDDQQLLKDLLAGDLDDMRTTDQRMADTLDSIYAAMIGTDQVNIITQTRKELEGGLKNLFGPGGTLGELKTSLEDSQQILGNLQQYSTATYEVITGFNSIIEALPMLGSALTNTTQAITDQITSLRKLNQNNEIATTEESDALIMNDGIIKFHPSDTFMRVNDSTMIAGTNVDGNKKLARAITGGSGVSKGDLQQLASMIVTAMKGVNLKVNVDNTYGGTSLNGGKRF